ncbi:MAG: hypothetical protein AAF664_01775 [Planctomycetota bacterium]
MKTIGRGKRSLLVAAITLASAHVNTSVFAQTVQQPTRLPTVVHAEGAAQSDHRAKELEALMAEIRRRSQGVSRPTSGDRTPEVRQPAIDDASVLATMSADGYFRTARKRLDAAYVDFDARAYVGAQRSAEDALLLIAQAIDSQAVASVQAGAQAQAALERAMTAISEARQFYQGGTPVMPEMVERLLRTHRTRVDLSSPGATSSVSVIADRYLHQARLDLHPLAANSVMAAEAMDLLAAITLRRAEPDQLPGPTAVTLRRAALQGQPANADLAIRLAEHLRDVGLADEAKKALGHTLGLRFDPNAASVLAKHLAADGDFQGVATINERLVAVGAQPISTPTPTANATPPGQRFDIVQMTPDAFARVSPVQQSGRPTQAAPPQVPVQSAPYPAVAYGGSVPQQEEKPSTWSRIRRSFSLPSMPSVNPFSVVSFRKPSAGVSGNTEPSTVSSQGGFNGGEVIDPSAGTDGGNAPSNFAAPMGAISPVGQANPYGGQVAPAMTGPNVKPTWTQRVRSVFRLP